MSPATTSSACQAMRSRMPAAYVSHGGGPLPLLGQQPDLASFLSDFPKNVPTPSAILVVTAHWVTSSVTVTSGATHPLLFDYSGFPQESYEYTYPAPGSPQLAEQISKLLESNSIVCEKDDDRGWDHGVFVPLKLMYPQANIPVVAMSLLNSMDPEMHINIGKALLPLRDQGVLILGSGMSFHNFDYLFTRSSQKKVQGQEHAKLFDSFLGDLLTGSSPAEDKLNGLVNWSQAPSSTECHPLGQEEHLIPLHVVFGTTVGADDDSDEIPTKGCKQYSFGMGSFAYSSFELN